MIEDIANEIQHNELFDVIHITPEEQRFLLFQIKNELMTARIDLKLKIEEITTSDDINDYTNKIKEYLKIKNDIETLKNYRKQVKEWY